MINSQIGKEINLPNDNFIIEDEKFNNGNNNEKIDIIPIEEISFGNIIFGVDNDFIVRNIKRKKNLLQKKQ